MNPLSQKLNSSVAPLFEYIKKQQENRKFIQTVELAATFILISFFLFFAIKPTALTISTLIGDIKSKELFSKEMKNKINQVILAQDLFSQVQERYAVVESALPMLPRFSQATDQIEGVLTKNNFDINRFAFIVKDKNNFSTNIGTASSFTSGLALLSDFLGNRRLLEIPRISFSVDRDTSPNRQVILNMPINVYYWKP